MSPPSPDRRCAEVARARGRSALVAGAVAVALLLSGLVALAAPAPASAQSAPVYGSGPLESIRQAATDQARCDGLTSAELMAMMVVPTYGEAGGPVPPPMALGRWDNLSVSANNARLFSFGSTSGPYVNAYFNAGVGLWQFDSAGGWNLTASDAIDTLTAARQAAATLAFRYCNPPVSVARDDASLRRYAWGPWFACTSGSTCENLYLSIYRVDRVDLGTDASVGRYGGMEQRSCDVAGLGTSITCWYVDPARSQGSTGWRAGTYDPTRTNYVTPLPKPFYVLRWGDREYRYWIQADTGYDIGITAHKRVTANARGTGELVWEGAAPLCDRTANRGSCSGTSGPRVAQTPWGPMSGNPFGSFDAASPMLDGSVRVSGWSIDPDSNDPTDVHVYVDGAWGGSYRASGSRPDVAAVVPGYGNAHGFDVLVSAGAGAHNVCVYAINIGPNGTTNPSFGCRDVVVDGRAAGTLDAVVPVTGGLRATGWALDADTSEPISVRLYVDGAPRATVSTGVNRPDVAAAYPRTGASRGFDATLQTTGGAHQVCAFAIEVGAGAGAERPIGCTSATASADAFGNWEVAAPTPGGIAVQGWAFDPDTGDATISFTVDGAAVATMPTDRPRPDVGAAYPGRGDLHGFAGVVRAGGGQRTLCAQIDNQGPGTSRSLGCRVIQVPAGNPTGNYEAAMASDGGTRLIGWLIDPDSTEPVAFHVYTVGGAWVTAAVADAPRPDVGAAYAGYGDAHGFDLVVPVPPGTGLCVYAINVGQGTTNPLMGCRAG